MLQDKPNALANRHSSTEQSCARKPAGYRSAAYAQSFSEFGHPRYLPRCGGWMLERPIPKSNKVDGMALYPLLSCSDWSSIGHDFDDLASEWITATAVTDPLGDYDEALLQRSFHHVQPYKDHFIAEMTGPPETFVKKSHRQNARRALRKVEVDVCTNPMDHIDEWVALFAVLADRHGITGLRAFSRQSFAQQLCVPGMVMFRASVDGETVGLDLWYVDGDVAQGHLVAFNETGYTNSASYATKWTLLGHFAERVRWVNFGGVPTATSSPDTGLEHFKRGWSNTTRKSYLCGCIFDDTAYQTLSQNIPDTSYFPAYRTGEV